MRLHLRLQLLIWPRRLLFMTLETRDGIRKLQAGVIFRATVEGSVLVLHGLRIVRPITCKSARIPMVT